MLSAKTQKAFALPARCRKISVLILRDFYVALEQQFLRRQFFVIG